MKLSLTLTSLTILLTFLPACHMGDSSHMSDSQQRQMQTVFNEIQQSFEAMMTSYQSDTTQMPHELQTLYDRMQTMHQQMSENHNHTMTNHKQQAMDRNGENRQMMEQSIHFIMQDSMTREWYSQMKSMHQQMVQEHQQRGSKKMAQLHRQQGQHFQRLLDVMPVPGQLDEEFVNEQANPDMLNGADLYAQNCASCHGSNGQGIGNTFPPLVNAKWVTGDKSIPVRIIRDGLTGEIEVNRRTYNGNMPSFKARLSLAEIAAIINHLRKKSEGDHSTITQDEIIQIFNSYGERTNPWQAEELLGE